MSLKRSIGPCLLALSLGLLVTVAVCYLVQPDRCAAMTAWPVWAWAIPGLILALASLKSRPKRYVLIMALLWLVFVGLFAEESRSLMRVGAWPDPAWAASRAQGRAIRVVSLNCAGGSSEAAGEVADYPPDIVLLQESPSRKEVESLGQRLFGKQAAVLWGIDTSVIARGRLAPAGPKDKPLGCFTHARVRLSSGRTVDVISIRLMPPVFRTDLWSGDCWRDYAAIRRVHRAQMQTVLSELRRIPRTAPVVIGGDFNAPQGDGSLNILRSMLCDTFAWGGKGWGNTVLNSPPILRFDQIWASPQLRAAAVVARMTRNSDHRLVVCDLVFDQD
jgi:hypothetical protein